MRKLILIESLQIGKFYFNAYIIECEDENVGCAVYIDKLEAPILSLMKKAENNEIELYINPEAVTYIADNGDPEREKRKVYFDEFVQFFTRNSKQVSKNIFKKMDLDHKTYRTLIYGTKKKYLTIKRPPA